MAKQVSPTQLSRRVAILRIAFGLIWAIDAAFKWQPDFRNSFTDTINSAAQNQPAWLQGWFTAWQHIIATNPQGFALAVAVIESLIAIALVLGLARRFTYLAAAVFSLMIWGVGEGFGGPYDSGSTDIGTGIIYAVVFLALYGLDQLSSEPSFAIDTALVRKFRWWHTIANPS